MIMPGGRGNIRPEDRTNGFEKNPQNINRNGQPISIKKQLNEILLKDGEVELPKKDFIKETKNSYIFKLPKQEALAMKLISMAMGNDNHSFNALKLILETFDGKATQPTKELNNKNKVVFISLPDNGRD